MKITFLGGGALRLLGVLDALLKCPETVKAPHIVLMDLDVAAARTICDLAARMPSAEGSPATFEATDDLDAALDGADFVYCVIRVGGVEGMDRDKRIGARYGYHGHDDYGPSAVMLTARTVPVVLDIARRMERLCPQARLLMFTNPIATLVDAVDRYSSIRSVGLCPGVYNFAHDMNHLFKIGVPNDGLWYRGGGLNHVSWVLPDATLDGELVMDIIMREFDKLAENDGAAKCGWDKMAPLIKLHGRPFMNNGHQHHFFYHDQLARSMAEYFEKTPVEDQRASSQHKAREVAEGLAKQPRIDDFWEQPPLDKCTAHPMGELGVQFLEAVLQDSGAELAVTTPNHGHIQGIMEGATVEAHSLVTRDGIAPLHLDPIPDSLKGLCQSTTEHQRYLVDASVSGDRDELLKALLSEPTIRDYARARPMFDELWAAAHAGT